MDEVKLLKFTVAGYRNFSAPITIDFTDVRNYQFSHECLTKDGLISKMGIYGHNGSGKSNLGFALFDIVRLLTDKNIDPGSVIPGIFLNVDNPTREARFKYEFRRGKDNITFEYTKTKETELHTESFSVNDVILYSYDYNNRSFSILEKEKINAGNLTFEYLQNGLSILRYIANNTPLPDDSSIKAVMDFVSHMLWFRHIPDNGYIGLETGSLALDDWIISNGLIGDFNRFLREVCNIDIKLDAVTTPDNKKILVEKHDNGLLIFQQVCSSGTSAAELFYFWMKRFNRISLLFMDEFDAYYHFELAEKIISIIKTYSDMQMIFTTHNTSLMGNDILRPDCYFFLNKGLLKSYVDRAGGREIREGHNLEKIYRNGGLNG